MVTHCSILAWRIPWTEEPGGLQSMELQKAGHNWATELNWTELNWGGSVVKNPPANAGDTGLIPGSGRPSGGGNGNPLQYSCLENPMGRGAWRATVHGVTKSQTWMRDSMNTTPKCTWKCSPLPQLLILRNNSSIYGTRIFHWHTSFRLNRFQYKRLVSSSFRIQNTHSCKE